MISFDSIFIARRKIGSNFAFLRSSRFRDLREHLTKDEEFLSFLWSDSVIGVLRKVSIMISFDSIFIA